MPTRPSTTPYGLKVLAGLGLPLVVFGVQWVFLDNTLTALPIGLLLAAGFYLGWMEKTPRASGWGGGSRAGIAVGFFLLAFWMGHPPKPQVQLPWQPYSEAAVAQAAAGRRPVLIDFYATWCGPCREMDRQTFSRAAVEPATRRFLLLRADVSQTQSPEVIKVMEKYFVQGLPTVIFLGTDGQEKTSLRLLGMEGPERFIQRLEAVR